MYNRNLFPGRLIPDAIEMEREGKGYIYDDNDKDVLKRLCDEINQTYPDYPYKFDYLCEISIVYTNNLRFEFIIKNVIYAINNLYFYNFKCENGKISFLAKSEDKEKIIEYISKKLKLINNE